MAIPDRIDFVTHVGFSNAYSSFIITERGAVNVARNGFGGDTRLAPMAGEDRLAANTIPGTSNLASTALFARQGDADDDGTTLDLFLCSEDDKIQRIRAGIFSTNLAATMPEAVSYLQCVSTPEDSTYGYVLSWGSPPKVFRWTRAAEPSAATVFHTMTGTTSNTEYGNIDARTTSGNIWVTGGTHVGGQFAAMIRLLDSSGATLFTRTMEDGAEHSYTMTGVSHALRTVNGMAAVGDDLIFHCLHNGAVAGGDITKFFHLTQDNVLTDISDRVYVDGATLFDWLSGPAGDLDWGQGGARGDRIAFEWGATLLLGEITWPVSGRVMVGIYFTGSEA